MHPILVCFAASRRSKQRSLGRKSITFSVLFFFFFHFYFIFSIWETSKQTENSHCLVHTPNAWNSWACAKPKPETGKRSLHRTTGKQGIWPSPAFRDTSYQQSEMENRGGTWIHALQHGVICPADIHTFTILVSSVQWQFTQFCMVQFCHL